MTEEPIKEKQSTGRPLLYNTPEELQFKIDEYFEKGIATRDVIVGREPNRQVVKVSYPTIGGLVLYCGFADRQSFYDYESYPQFSCTIKKARSRIAQHYEELLQQGLGAGAIFALKNFGWVDKTEHELSGPNGVPLVPSKIEVIPIIPVPPTPVPPTIG